MRTVTALSCFLALATSTAVGDAAPRRDRPFARIPQTRTRLYPTPVNQSPHKVFTSLANLGERAKTLNPTGRIKRVYYPMGASDVATALRSFEGPHGGPTELMIADIMPFGAPRETATVHADPARKQSYVGEGVHEGNFIDLRDFLGKTKLVGPAMLWELEHLGAQQVRVEYLDQNGKRAKPPSTPREPRVDDKWGFFGQVKNPVGPAFYDPADRDVVRVSFTLNGARRTILYVQHDMLDPHGVPPVFGKFLDAGIDAYVEKASLDLTRDARYAQLRSRAVAKLDAEHGVFVTDEERSAEAVSDQRGGHAQRLQDDRTGFGYGSMYVNTRRPIAGALRWDRVDHKYLRYDADASAWLPAR